MGYKVVVAGATGNVGREMLNILEEVEFPVDKIHAIASRKSIGVEVSFGNQILKCEDVEQFDFSKVDVVLMSVTQTGHQPGLACHTGRHSCFYSVLMNGQWQTVEPVLKDPDTIYK